MIQILSGVELLFPFWESPRYDLERAQVGEIP